MKANDKEQALIDFKASNVALETTKHFGNTFDALVDTIKLLWKEQDKLSSVKKKAELSDEEEIDYKFINYNRDEDGIDIWVKDNPPIHLEDCYELSTLAEQLKLINAKVWSEPF